MWPAARALAFFAASAFRRVVVAVDACQAGAGRLVKRYAEFHLRDGVHDGLVNVLHRLDEMRLPEDQVAALGNFQRNEFEVHY